MRPGEGVTYVGGGESEVMSKWDRARLVGSPEILTRDKNRNEVNHRTEDGASLTAVRQTHPLVSGVIMWILVLMLPVVGAGRSKKNPMRYSESQSCPMISSNKGGLVILP